MASPRPFSRYEFTIAWRYLRARRAEGGVSVMTWISLIGIALGVMAPLIWCAGMDFPTAAEAAKHRGASLYVGFGLITNGDGIPGAATDIAWRTGHYLLALLPLAWLVLARRGLLAKVPFPS